MKGFKFTDELLRLALDGIKTQTRRCDDELRFHLGEVFPIQDSNGVDHGWARITHVVRQRVQDISEDACIAEGCRQTFNTGLNVFGNVVPGMPETWDEWARKSFAKLWDPIAKPDEKWNDNPLVWAYTFKRTEAP